jgi:hypothetical protein
MVLVQADRANERHMMSSPAVDWTAGHHASFNKLPLKAE